MWLRCCRERKGTLDRGRVKVKDAVLDGESGSRSRGEAADGVGVGSESLAVNPTT